MSPEHCSTQARIRSCANSRKNDPKLDATSESTSVSVGSPGHIRMTGDSHRLHPPHRAQTRTSHQGPQSRSSALAVRSGGADRDSSRRRSAALPLKGRQRSRRSRARRCFRPRACRGSFGTRPGTRRRALPPPLESRPVSQVRRLADPDATTGARVELARNQLSASSRAPRIGSLSWASVRECPRSNDQLRDVHRIAQMGDAHTGDDDRVAEDDRCVRELVEQPHSCA
jgi:hypothetical protein